MRRNRDRDRVQRHALSHQVRLDIMGLFTRDRDRSLAADALHADLLAAAPDTYRDYSEGQVFYHRVVLQDAELLPG